MFDLHRHREIVIALLNERLHRSGYGFVLEVPQDITQSRRKDTPPFRIVAAALLHISQAPSITRIGVPLPIHHAEKGVLVLGRGSMRHPPQNPCPKETFELLGELDGLASR